MMDTLLIHGYVREIEKSLVDNQIIPIDIYHICFDFYFTTKFIFYITSIKKTDSSQQNMNIMNIANIDTKKGWNCKVFELDDDKSEITINDTHNEKWSVDAAGICFAKNIKLPLCINHKLLNLHDTENNNKNFKFNNIIFRCGGKSEEQATNYCAALILHPHEFQKRINENITAYNWKLPLLPQSIYSNVLVHSNYHNALFSIGGKVHFDGIQEIYKLSLDMNEKVYFQQNMKEWKWEKLNLEMESIRSSPCCTMINHSTKLIVITGIGMGYVKTTELFDFDKNKRINLKECNVEREDGGIYYDETNELLYIGGGYNDNGNSFKSVECYNFEKNIWYNLPSTNFKHDMNPMLFTQDTNLLYIISVLSNRIEYIDLRESKSWTQTDDKLSNIFNTKFNTEQVTQSRIVGN